MTEQWKDVVGFEGLYQVSSFGVIRSVGGKPITHAAKAGTMISYKTKSKILKPWPIGRYHHLYVRLYAKIGGRGTGKTIGLHRVVLEAFVGPCPEGMQCCHEDGNPANNRLENLRWDTPKNNMADRDRHGRHARGSACKVTKLTEADIPIIRARKSTEWGAMSKVAREYGVDTATIRDIWIGKTWKHVL